MGTYDAVAQRALATIAKKGGVVIFPNSGLETYNSDDTWTEDEAPGADVTGSAIQIEGDPDRFAALGLSLINSVTLLIAAAGLTVSVVPGLIFEWAGIQYSTASVDTLAPDGTPILYTVIGSV